MTVQDAPIIGQHGGKRTPGPKPKVEQRDAYTILAAARAKREEYNAELARLAYEEKSGKLIPADEVSAAWLDHIAIAKGRFLALPARLAPDVLGLSNLREIEKVIRAAIVEIMEEMTRAPGD